jgi:hypothetical protein
MACWKCRASPDPHNSSETAELSSSRFEHLLATNDAPTCAETPAIQDFITNGQRRVHALEIELDNLRAKMDRLIAERDDLAERVQQFSAVLSPIRRFPKELLCEIFSSTLPCTRRIDEDEVDQLPWYLGHISKTWQAIALAYLFLWMPIAIFHEAILMKRFRHSRWLRLTSGPGMHQSPCISDG